VGRRLDGPSALDRSIHESRAESAAVEVTRLPRKLSRPRRHHHAAGDVGDRQPLSRLKAQPVFQMDPVTPRLRLHPRDVDQQLREGITDEIESSSSDRTTTGRPGRPRRKS
jgi:hypothetical protein